MRTVKVFHPAIGAAGFLGALFSGKNVIHGMAGFHEEKVVAWRHFEVGLREVDGKWVLVKNLRETKGDGGSLVHDEL